MGRRAGARARVVRRDRDRREHRARHGARRGPARRASQAWQPNPGARGHLSDEHHRLPRRRVARSQVRRAAASTQPRLRPRGDSVARARRRRQHRDLPAARCRAHSHAAGREPAAARRASDCRYQGRPHGTVHRTPADAHLSALRADPRSPAGVRRTGRVGHDVVQPDAQRRSAVRAGDLGERRVLQHARREGDARPHAERRRRRPRLRVARRRRQLWILAARARRRSIGDWSRARSRGSRVSDRWGGAAAVLRD